MEKQSSGAGASGLRLSVELSRLSRENADLSKGQAELLEDRAELARERTKLTEEKLAMSREKAALLDTIASLKKDQRAERVKHLGETRALTAQVEAANARAASAEFQAAVADEVEVKSEMDFVDGDGRANHSQGGDGR
jgi:hypothetical protein